MTLEKIQEAYTAGDLNRAQAILKLDECGYSDEDQVDSLLQEWDEGAEKANLDEGSFEAYERKNKLSEDDCAMGGGFANLSNFTPENPINIQDKVEESMTVSERAAARREKNKKLKESLGYSDQQFEPESDYEKSRRERAKNRKAPEESGASSGTTHPIDYNAAWTSNNTEDEWLNWWANDKKKDAEKKDKEAKYDETKWGSEYKLKERRRVREMQGGGKYLAGGPGRPSSQDPERDEKWWQTKYPVEEWGQFDPEFDELLKKAKNPDAVKAGLEAVKESKKLSEKHFRPGDRVIFYDDSGEPISGEVYDYTDYADVYSIMTDNGHDAEVDADEVYSEEISRIDGIDESKSSSKRRVREAAVPVDEWRLDQEREVRGDPDFEWDDEDPNDDWSMYADGIADEEAMPEVEYEDLDESRRRVREMEDWEGEEDDLDPDWDPKLGVGEYDDWFDDDGKPKKKYHNFVMTDNGVHTRGGKYKPFPPPKPDYTDFEYEGDTPLDDIMHPKDDFDPYDDFSEEESYDGDDTTYNTVMDAVSSMLADYENSSEGYDEFLSDLRMEVGDDLVDDYMDDIETAWESKSDDDSGDLNPEEDFDEE